MKPKHLGAGTLVLALLLLTPRAHATLSADLSDLVVQAQGLDASFTTATFSPLESCMDIGGLSTSVRDYVAAAEAVYGRLAPPTRPTATDLDNLATMSAFALDMAVKARLLSGQLQTVSGAYDLFELRSMLAAMLTLSRDIGTMADRILEMADRILAMADNIGVMADRIVATQRIQSANLAATQAALLTTQLNMVALTSSLSTIGYNLSLGLIRDDSAALSQQMAGTTLGSTTMGAQLGALAASADAISARSVALYGQVTAASQGASFYIDGDTLSLIADLGPLQAALASALDGFARSVEALAPVTDTVVLGDATAAMLQLAADIGTMSDRIVEMNDKIIVMADNIGAMSARIVETQDIQQANIALTQASLQSAQAVTVSVIQTWGL
ncbi:MAG: hypothetical protein H6730_19585 [Deltaproteobacteria bacterium]|nr:hypothetical protein [Deltaproteobacteria bacterium]